jgi:hypothetical protein
MKLIGEKFAEKLRKIAQARGRERRARAIDDLAESVKSANAAEPFLTRLTETDRHGQRLALEIALRLPLPLPESVCRLIQPALGSARFPVPLRLNVAAQVLRSLPADSPLVGDLLKAVTKGLAPPRAAERLRFIQQRVPGHAAVQWLSDELGKQAAIPCPRCDVKLQRSELVVHLWQVHRLLMEGSRARDPWKIIEDWLREYARNGRRELLERGCELGQQLDPAAGLTRVHRLLLKAGLTDEEAKENLTTQAEGRRASLCPHCYAMVPQPHEGLPAPLSSSRGRISGGGYTVEVSDRYVFTRLFVATPDEIIHEGPEPGLGLTQRGSVIFLIGPIVLLALGIAALLPLRLVPPLAPVALILLGALLLYLRLRLRHGPAMEATQRAVDHAWEMIVPELHRPNFIADDAAFLGSLAMTSIGLGSPATREKLLERVGKLTRKELLRAEVLAADLAALRCLELDDAIRAGRDPVPIFADELAGCLTGDLPLQYAEQLLEAWPNAARDQGQRARLRILICARAFEHGFDARDLQELGRISPLLGQAYASEDIKGLARLRWLWNAKPARLWQKNGSATTVFDLARYPALGGQFLESRPDLLLFQPMSAGDDREAGAPILICEGGIVYRDIVVSDPQTPIYIHYRTMMAVRGFDLYIDKRKIHFRQEPALLLKRLEGWVEFLFKQLLPGAKAIAGRRTPAKLRPLLKQKTMLCPECGNSFLALRGEVGILTDAQTG